MKKNKCFHKKSNKENRPLLLFLFFFRLFIFLFRTRQRRRFKSQPNCSFLQISKDENAVATSDDRRRHVSLKRRIVRRLIGGGEIKNASRSKRIVESERLDESERGAKHDDRFETHSSAAAVTLTISFVLLDQFL